MNLSNLSIKKRQKEFKYGRMLVHNAPQCGRPRILVAEINTITTASITEDNRQLSTRTLEILLNMLKMSMN